MSGNDKELPGFYRDPITGKYYRDVPGCSFNPALKKLKIENKISEEFKIKPKVTNVIHYLNARELKTVGGVQESKEYLKMRLHMKEKIQWTELDKLRRHFKFTSVDYIRGSNDFIYGLWNYKNGRKYVLGRMKLIDYDDHYLYFHKAFGYVTDMCEGINEDFIVVYDSFSRNGILVERVDEYDRMPLVQYGQYFAGSRMEPFRRHIYCCSCNKINQTYAFGCENCIAFMDIIEREHYLRVNGTAHTIDFDNTGNLIALGMHTGTLCFYDLRTKQMVMNVEVSKSCLLDTSMLNSHLIVVAGTDDVLCNVDIRKKEVVTEFFAHKHQGVRKAPLSTASNMLCALGSDNRIRIWDLLGGLPIHEAGPLENPHNNISGWLCNVGNQIYYYHFEGATRKIFQIQ